MHSNGEKVILFSSLSIFADNAEVREGAYIKVPVVILFVDIPELP